MRPKEVLLLNIEIGRNIVGVKSFLLTSSDSVWNMTSEVFYQEGNGELEANPPRCRNDRSKMRWVDVIGQNQYSWWYRTAYYLKNTLMARSSANETFRYYVVPYAAAIGDSFLLMHDNARR